MIWMGAQKEASFTSRTWRWVTGEVVDRPPWGREQPNNYNGEQNCVVVDGARDWLWNDVGCNLDYFHSICMFRMFRKFIDGIFFLKENFLFIYSSHDVRKSGQEAEQYGSGSKFLDGCIHRVPLSHRKRFTRK